jgi:hypothetical protein
MTFALIGVVAIVLVIRDRHTPFRRLRAEWATDRKLFFVDANDLAGGRSDWDTGR